MPPSPSALFLLLFCSLISGCFEMQFSFCLLSVEDPPRRKDPVKEICDDIKVKIADLGNACWVVSIGPILFFFFSLNCFFSPQCLVVGTAWILQYMIYLCMYNLKFFCKLSNFDSVWLLFLQLVILWYQEGYRHWSLHEFK